MATPTAAIITTMTKPQRPPIETIETGAALKDWYWLKDEIVAYARVIGVSPAGQKFDIIDRVAHFLDTGERRKPSEEKPTPQKTETEWHKMPLTRETVIDAGYRNNQNVRRFFKAEIDKRFSFNIEFMNWMKANTGKTLGDAVDEWLAIEAKRKAGVRAKIPHHNQFNAYVQAFFDDNPDRSMDDARHFWKLKRSLPGHNRYERSDLELTDD
ncbi:MAG: DUF6434 domain-containing protein [Pseudomonadota bacterium]